MTRCKQYAILHVIKHDQHKSTSRRVKESLNYLKGTITWVSVSKDSGFELTAFSDSDHGRMPDTKALLERDTLSLVINFNKVVRLGINPMIQPEPEDLPKDNPKLEIAVLRIKKKCMDKGSKERSPPHNLRQKLGQYICCQNHKLIADIENDIMDPVMQCTTLPSHSGFSQQKLVSFVTEIHKLSIDISLRDCQTVIMQKNDHVGPKTKRSQDGKDIKNNDKGSRPKITANQKDKIARWQRR
ncbi:hypothetical protein Tco_0890692 [Tanacetum coccineum]|uniref:Uncharacterized protein n=1 Tax=Tanacetum coccineum TaxID=301880 RepID=A0ABQ5C0S2_9ASTR